MRLAVIADIHGGVAALEAVVADVKTRGAATVPRGTARRATARLMLPIDA
jgi:hypothetical protein